MREKTIYLDYNATTPCSEKVIEAMIPFLKSDFANPASTHLMGRKAAKSVEKSRKQIANTLGVEVEGVIFTSGATESNNMIFNAMVNSTKRKSRIVLSEGEHKSVLEPAEGLLEKGFEVVKIPLTNFGTVDLSTAKDIINNNTLLVSVHAANNETGVIQPIKALAEIAHSHDAFFHCDAAQILGKVPFSFNDFSVDFASISAHKLYGPKGIGACYIRPGKPMATFSPLLKGGSQEFGLRSGTLNVPAIIGFGKACEIVDNCIEEESKRITKLRNFFESQVTKELSETFIIGEKVQRLPGTSNLGFVGVPSDVLIAQVPHLCISRGSACTSGAPSPSHVVLACGYDREIARCVIRISIGRYTSENHVERAIQYITKSVDFVRVNSSSMC